MTDFPIYPIYLTLNIRRANTDIEMDPNNSVIKMLWCNTVQVQDQAYNQGPVVQS